MAASNVLRMSGINSGLDTEALVDAMSSATKTKINKKNREVITLKWKQEAYQSITTKLTDFQKKYFDLLDSKNNLRSPSTYNKYKADVFTKNNGVLTDGSPAGVTVNPQSGATAGTYNVKVHQTATQAKYQGKSMDNSALDLSAYTDSAQTYSFSLKAGGKDTIVTFNGGSSDDVVKQINRQLTDAFGEANNTATTGRGLVYINDSGKIISADRSAVNMGGVMNMNGDVALNTAGLKTGDNKLSIVADGKSYDVSFKTYADSYFASNTTEADKFQKLHFEEEARKQLDAELEAGTISVSDFVNETDYAAAKKDDYDIKYLAAVQEAESAYDAQLTKEYDAGVKNGTITEDFDTWKAKQPEFDNEAFKAKFDSEYDEESFRSTYEAQKYAEKKGLNADDYKLTDEQLASYANRYELKQALKGVTLDDGSKLTLTDDGTLSAENGAKIGVTAAADSTNTLGAASATSSAAQVTTATTLKDLGVEDEATFSINGVSFTFTSDYTVKKMMSEINNAAAAGANMSFSTLTNSFSISSSAYGTEAALDFSAEAGSEGEALLATLGLTSGTFTKGTNLEIEVNGELVETSSNSYSVDGTTLTFNSAAAGSEFTYEVKKDVSTSVEAIKEFVEDYNKLISEVYEYLDEEADSDYYALTDDDIEEMDLSEKQQEKWEEKAKAGLLHNDSTVGNIMQKMRSILYTSVKTADGQSFNIYSMGIKTTSDYTKHGQLTIDTKALETAFENYADQISELFTGTTVDENGNVVNNGIMSKLNDVLTSAVKTTGQRKDKGTLVQLAGTKSGTAATDNSIYDQLKKMNTMISDLEDRYEREQDRYWSQYTALEKMMSELNSQSSYFSQLMTF